uniref:Uncharacterized protein n=1 Tax=Fagus sylvatica TaxID=28930 RepID=A0A2N9EXE4_FAGSY
MSTANSAEQQGVKMETIVTESPMLTANSVRATRGENGDNSDKIFEVDCKFNKATRGGNGRNNGRIFEVDCKFNRATRGGNGRNSGRIFKVDCKFNRATSGGNGRNPNEVGSAEFRGSALYQAFGEDAINLGLRWRSRTSCLSASLSHCQDSQLQNGIPIYVKKVGFQSKR